MGNYQSASADDRSFVTDSSALGKVENKIESLQGRHSSHTDSLALGRVVNKTKSRRDGRGRDTA